MWSAFRPTNMHTNSMLRFGGNIFFSSPFGPTNTDTFSHFGFVCMFVRQKKTFNGTEIQITQKPALNKIPRDHKAPKGPPMTPNGIQWTPQVDKWSPMTPKRRPIGLPQVTNGAPMVVQRHSRQPKGPQRPPKTGQKSPMKPKTQKIAIMASFRSQYPHFNVPSGISNLTFKTSR